MKRAKIIHYFELLGDCGCKRVEEVFREGAGNYARGGRAPRQRVKSVTVFLYVYKTASPALPLQHFNFNVTGNREVRFKRTLRPNAYKS